MGATTPDWTHILLLPLLLLSRFSRVRLCATPDGSPPDPTVPGIFQARTLEWVAISSSNAWKWNRSVVSDSSKPHGLQPTRFLRPWDFPGKSTGVGCHCLLQIIQLKLGNIEVCVTQRLCNTSLCPQSPNQCLLKHWIVPCIQKNLNVFIKSY